MTGTGCLFKILQKYLIIKNIYQENAEFQLNPGIQYFRN